MLPFKAWSSLLMAFRDRRQMFRTGSSLRGRTGQLDFSRRIRVAIRRKKRFSRARFEQQLEDALALGATVGPFTSNVVGGGGPTDHWLPKSLQSTLAQLARHTRKLARKSGRSVAVRCRSLDPKLPRSSTVLGGWLVAKTPMSVPS